MDDSHKDEENQKDGAGVLKSTTDSGDHKESDELADKGNNQDTQAGDRGDAHVPQETGAGFTAHEMEDDDPDGLRKSLKKGFKAVKQFFMGSDELRKGGNLAPKEVQVQPQLTRAVPPNEDSDIYDFSHQKRGRAVIINNEKFLPGTMFNSRPGSSKDAVFLKEVFKKLGFDVKSYDNLTAAELKMTLEREAHQYDHHNADCLAVAILSHGDCDLQEKAWSYSPNRANQNRDKVRCDLIFGVDGQCISTASVMQTFQDDWCPGLSGKPRLFFLQACRGDAYDDGMDVAVVPDEEEEEEEDKVDGSEETDTGGVQMRHKRSIITPAPIFKDYLVMYATTPGHFAWRRSSGTWFVQSLHSVFTKQLTPHMSLTQALTRVARMVAQGYESHSDKPNHSGKKQMPVMESMLIKDVYFTDK